MTPWFPVAGAAIAAVSAVGMLIAGVDPVLTVAILMLWLGTLWMARPEPPPAAQRKPAEAFSRASVEQMIEPLGVPVMLLQRGRIALANAAARLELGQHILGQDARMALRHPEAIALLDPGQTTASATIAGFLGPRSIWHLTLRPIDQDHVLVEMLDRTAEADISRAHTDFVANASHELRTPLASIIGYVETLTEDGHAPDEQTQRRFLGTVLKEAKRLQSLVEDLMSLSRVEAEKHDRPDAQVDLTKVAASAAADMASFGAGERIRFTSVNGPARVYGDARQLDQLIRNLIDNAVKYGNPDEPVDVVIDGGNGREVLLQVEDRGDGIAADHIPHLTRRFYRTDPGRSRAQGGTGLGLAIVKHIVERHRGRFDIESIQGRGTTVSVRFEGFGRAQACHARDTKL